MNGQSEYTRNPNMDQGLVMIERGGKGAVITNLTSEEKRIHSETTLADGQYKDTITGHIFEVSNKQISGKMAPRTVAVLYPITQ